MAYGRKVIPPPATPFEDFMATTSERMIAAKIDFIEFLRELPPAAWIAIGVVILVLAASSLNLRGKKEASAEPSATTATDAVGGRRREGRGRHGQGRSRGGREGRRGRRRREEGGRREG